MLSEKEMKKLAKSALYKGFKKMYSVDPQMAKDNPAYEGKFNMFKKIYDQKFQKGGKAEPVAKKVMPLLDMGGMEKDYRAEGGLYLLDVWKKQMMSLQDYLRMSLYLQQMLLETPATEM